jgi:hypothetical protein
MPRQHSDLVKRDYVAGLPIGDGPALEWIGARLSEHNPAAGPAPAMSTATSPEGQLSGAWVSALGPVALQLRDASGRSTGRSRGAAEAKPAEVPETRYEQLPGGEYAFAKRDMPYLISLDAEGAGSLDLKMRVFGNGRIERTAVYLGVSLGPQGHAELAVNKGVGHADSPKGWPALQVDADGDGVFEASVEAAAVLDERASADTSAPALLVEAPAPSKAGPGEVQLRWRADDQGAGVYAQSGLIDPGTKAERPVTNGQTVKLPVGQHRLLVVAVDRAGNASSQELVFTVPG